MIFQKYFGEHLHVTNEPKSLFKCLLSIEIQTQGKIIQVPKASYLKTPSPSDSHSNSDTNVPPVLSS